MKKIILVDVDKTLVDRNYELTVEKRLLNAAVTRAQAQGVPVGLNSDSALITLKQCAADWGMRGPIVAERGGVVLFDADSAPFYTVPEAEVFPQFRIKVIEELMRTDRLPKYLTILGNVNGLANRLPSYPGRDGLQTAVLINSLRARSFSCYVRSRQGNEWLKTGEALDELMDILYEAAGRHMESWDMDKNVAYGICILHHRDTQKSKALGELLSAQTQIYMIGDSMADHLRDERVVHCAVGNSEPEFKERCRFVAKNEMTAGVIEMVETILEM